MNKSIFNKKLMLIEYLIDRRKAEIKDFFLLFVESEKKSFVISWDLVGLCALERI